MIIYIYILIQNCISNPKEPSCVQASGGGQNHASPFSDAIPEPGTLHKTKKHLSQVSVELIMNQLFFILASHGH